MKNSIAIWFALAAGFAAAPGSNVAVDSPTNAHDGVLEGTSTLRGPEVNALFTCEACVQPLDDFQADTNTGYYIPGASDGLGHGLLYIDEVLESSGAYGSSSSGDFSEARRVLGEVAIYNYALKSARVVGQHQAGTALETSTLTLSGLVLILFGLMPRGWRLPLRFCGSDAGLSRARIFRVGAVKFRKRSEAELNSFSARYATVEVQEEAPLGGRRSSAAFQRP